MAVGQEEGCPRIILSKLFKTFTVETFSNGRYDNGTSLLVDNYVKYLQGLTKLPVNMYVIIAACLNLIWLDLISNFILKIHVIYF